MSIIKNFIVIINIVLFCGCSSNSYKSLYKDNPAFYSYAIGNVSDSKPKITHADEVYITPASTQKVLTSLLAYKMLGEDYTYKTSLYTTNTKCTPKDMIISFSGDPTLKSEDLTKILSRFKGGNFRRIILDASKYQTPAHSPNILLGDVGTSYGSPVSSIIIDHNLVNIKITHNNKCLKVTSDSGYKINSSITVSDQPTAINTKWQNQNIILTGNININEQNKEMTISPIEINQYAINKIQKIIKPLNICGEIKIINNKSKLPKQSKLIDKVTSPCLDSFLSTAVKKSDNLVLDSLYLTMVNSQKEIHDWSDGNKIIKDLACQYIGVDLKDAIIVDGSGLSRYNRIQARTLYEILKKGYDVPAFVNALMTPGEAGSTLATRKDLLPTIKAKTGTMSGISCLCGYNNTCFSPKIFVICANSFASPVSKMLPSIDKFINSQVKN